MERTAEGFNLDRLPRVDMLKRVLVVDDDPSLRAMLRAVLEREGYQVASAIDGGEALRLLDTCPDIVLLDLMMPGLDGWGFLRILRDHCERRTLPIPRVVVVSAHLRMNPQELIGLGADALVTKPFDIEELYTLLRHLPHSGVLTVK